MSTVAQPAVLRTIVRSGGAEQPDDVVPARPLVRLVTFAALGGFGVVEWGHLTSPPSTVRLLGLLAIALVLVAVGPRVTRYRRVLVPAVTVVALLAALVVCGIPVRWIVHVRVAVTADWIGQGLQALPGIYIPYVGINAAVKLVMQLGAAVLLLDGALLLAFAPPNVGDLRRAGAALPLVALAMVPATLVRPSLPYLDGLVLFALLAAFVWGERVRSDNVAALVVVCAVTGAAGMLVAPRLDSHQPWINYRALSNTLAPHHVALFDWTQSYGPLQWPQVGRQVLEIRAKEPYYWKAEDLDLFNGTGWADANFTGYDLSHNVLPSSIARWTQTIQVTVTEMDSTDVIGAGESQFPIQPPGYVYSGNSPFTWATTPQLRPGDSYRIRVYTPDPTNAQLAHAGTGYPSTIFLRPYLTLEIPVYSSTEEAPQQVVFPLFGTRGGPQNTSDLVNYPSGAGVIAQSPYARVYALAHQLEAGAPTPYAYLRHVLAYLDSGRYTYRQDVPAEPYPLISFLFNTKQGGYCQQFAGAMALLLRMGGVPARVAVGFTSGSYDAATKQYDVTDRDAHAWVEAWFPKYGWVTFDPTPASSDPAQQSSAPKLSAIHGGAAVLPNAHPNSHGLGKPGSATIPRPRHTGGSSDTAALLAVGITLLALGVVALVVTHGPSEPSEEELLSELERALARSGRPIAADVTLSALEDRFRASSDAEGYVRALRLARFAGRHELPSRRQRRALRRQLRSSLGTAGALRALWALPPRWNVHRLAVSRPARGIHSR